MSSAILVGGCLAGVVISRELSRAEGILLDPVYTGKAFAGLIDLAEKRQLGSNGSINFLHTGGLSALFAFENYGTQQL